LREWSDLMSTVVPTDPLAGVSVVSKCLVVADDTFAPQLELVIRVPIEPMQDAAAVNESAENSMLTQSSQMLADAFYKNSANV